MSEITLDQILSDLRGFGIEDISEPVTIVAGGKEVTLKLATIPTEDELETLVATDEFKGHAWMARVKVEILSRSISEINGVSLRDLKDSIVTDPATGEEASLRNVLRNLIMGWGQEVRNLLWKVLMTHCQRVEDRLFESLPDNQVMTDVEKRLMERAFQEVSVMEQEAIKESIKAMIDPTEG